MLRIFNRIRHFQSLRDGLIRHPAQFTLSYASAQPVRVCCMYLCSASFPLALGSPFIPAFHATLSPSVARSSEPLQGLLTLPHRFSKVIPRSRGGCQAFFIRHFFIRHAPFFSAGFAASEKRNPPPGGVTHDPCGMRRQGQREDAVLHLTVELMEAVAVFGGE